MSEERLLFARVRPPRSKPDTRRYDSLQSILFAAAWNRLGKRRYAGGNAVHLSVAATVVPGLRQFSAVEVLRMATINGAFALGLSHERGSIEVNKRADLTFVDIENISIPVPHSSSRPEEWAQLLVDHLAMSDVSDVLIGGMFMLRNREFVDHREDEIIKEFRSVQGKFFPESASLRPANSFSDSGNPSVAVPFFDDTLPAQEYNAGFENGSAPSEKSSTISEIGERAASANPLLNLPKVKREPVKPELPKNTRRVFGDDDI